MSDYLSTTQLCAIIAAILATADTPTGAAVRNFETINKILLKKEAEKEGGYIGPDSLDD